MIALRYHNVYGPRMPRDTPYAGVASIFRSAAARGEAPRVFEDGGQRRDFVHVHDVARANLCALTAPAEVTGAFNVASGEPRTILDVARAMTVDSPDPEVVGGYRLGDVRHVFASPERACRELSFEAAVPFAAGHARLHHRAAPILRGRLPMQIAVIAKEPVPGRVKTRLCPPFSPAQAAELAEAALRDTLRTVRATAAARHVLVLDGRPGPWVPAGFDVLAQRGDGLGSRLAAAFTDCVAACDEPVVLVGMDTPAADERHAARRGRSAGRRRGRAVVQEGGDRPGRRRRLLAHRLVPRRPAPCSTA